MKNILNKKCFVAALALGTLSLAGCIEETLPLGGTVTSGQVEGSAKGMAALVNGPSAIITDVFTTSDSHYDWGYGSIMHIRDVMTADMAIANSNYNHYSSWASNEAMDERYVTTYFPFEYYYKAIQTANEILRPIDPETATDEEMGYYAVGSAWRAFFYLDAARMYEFLPNDVTSNITEEGNDITNLTMPIVTEKTTEEEARNNPRATREEMLEFIENDLNVAEENIDLLPEDLFNDATPNMAVIYGLKARLYMWVEDYPKAAEYARKAIDLGWYGPMTREQCLNTATGFNTVVQSWMLSSQQVSETYAVNTGIINWTSWMSNETNYGYASAGPYVMITSDLYNKISDDDFRKLLFKAPAGTSLSGSEPVLFQAMFDYYLPTYASLKFRPGNGNYNDSKTGNMTAFPLMRIEEMYFIEAEAIAHDNPSRGKALLESFMKENRCPTYTCKYRSQEEIVREIVTQKSIEFFGEGLSFFDIKRLNYSVDRSLSSNVSGNEKFKTEGRPAWMNFCLTYSERTNNKGIQGFQNPDPSGKYKPVD